MRSVNPLNHVFFVLVVVLLCGYACAAEPKINESETLAVVPVKGGKIDQRVYRQFDLLVPELKKISRSRIVKLECRYFGQPDREQDVDSAFKLITVIEKYLRVRHKLDLDLWVTIDVKPTYAKSSPVLTLAVFSDSIKNVDTTLHTIR